MSVQERRVIIVSRQLFVQLPARGDLSMPGIFSVRLAKFCKMFGRHAKRTKKGLGIEISLYHANIYLFDIFLLFSNFQ